MLPHQERWSCKKGLRASRCQLSKSKEKGERKCRQGRMKDFFLCKIPCFMNHLGKKSSPSFPFLRWRKELQMLKQVSCTEKQWVSEPEASSSTAYICCQKNLGPGKNCNLPQSDSCPLRTLPSIYCSGSSSLLGCCAELIFFSSQLLVRLLQKCTISSSSHLFRTYFSTRAEQRVRKASTLWVLPSTCGKHRELRDALDATLGRGRGWGGFPVGDSCLQISTESSGLSKKNSERGRTPKH